MCLGENVTYALERSGEEAFTLDHIVTHHSNRIPQRPHSAYHFEL